MKRIILILSLFMGSLFATPTMASQFQATTITGRKVSLDAYLAEKKMSYTTE